MQEIRKESHLMSFSDTMTKVRLNSRGYSLIDVVVSAGVASIVALGSAALVTQTKMVANQGEFQATLDSQHNQDILRAKNISFVMDRIAHNPTFGSGAGIPNIAVTTYSTSGSTGGATSGSNRSHDDDHEHADEPSPAVGGSGTNASGASMNIGRLVVSNPCFQGGGSNCNDYNRDWTDLTTSADVQIQPEETMNGISTDKKLFRKSQFKLVCSSDKCSRIIVRIITKPSREVDCGGCHNSAERRGLYGRERVTELDMPVSYFADKKNLNYEDCRAAGKALTAVNYNNLKTNCDGYPTPTTCSGNIAAVGYGGSAPDCYPAVRTGTCVKGLRAVGPNAGSCN